mmetsp:Transcript_29793/g.41158  ORF Transcript_29793/g.41158 Transcript_29793/m.41158 type:complete len:166 (+) Transcript_29793:56-553(+)|eukprot:CAMPEP_0201493494 /NCGR_PEP_ID=MMETSP0151_2-20130828/38958_1 /ASSEMBLY_ACC=CAM_ASM_000257 /TAXON_ID=200890 /ORGANISM="Paramoeba atlantica, Strain 621/1 / CCAP 1560/9" /LENGTH=165 /DNA_ID=CAMNT_0047880959 /DNA_START=56 /DNA_END=553 /DNA_ORIENTATION=+
MPPKFDPNQEHLLVVRCVGGEPVSTGTLGPKLGPFGLPAKKVGEDIQKATKDWKGLKITCHLVVKNRQAEIKIVPSAASLIIRALKEPLRDRKKVKNIKHSGNISYQDALSIAKQLRPRSLSRNMAGTVREVLGTCQSVGCTVQNLPPHDLIEQIKLGALEVPEE